MSERKQFKFYKSYFDVASELSDKDRLAFYDAMMKKQFWGIDPIFKGIVNLAWISQKHSIDAQIKGWGDKMNMQLSDIHPMQGGSLPPALQVEVKEEEEEKEEIYNQHFDVYTFDEFWNDYDKKVGKDKSMIKFNRLSKEDKNKIKETVKDYVASTPDVKFRKNPETYLNNKSWNDEIVTHSNVVKKANKLDEIQNNQSSINF